MSKIIALWCNGSTSDFGSDSSGSNPGGATIVFYSLLVFVHN